MSGRRRRRAPAAALAAMLLAAAGCASSSPFEPLGPLNDAERLAVLSRRTTVPPGGLAARLVVESHLPGRRGTFDAEAYFVPPATMAISAYKDVVFDVRPVFDVGFSEGVDGAAGEYHIDIYPGPGEPDAEQVSDEGPLERFPAEHPEFAAFYWAREAMVLPGVFSPGRAQWSDDGTTLATVLHDDRARVLWTVDPQTLEVTEGVVWDGLADSAFARLRYGDYFRFGDQFVPGRVEVVGSSGTAEMTMRIRAVEPLR